MNRLTMTTCTLWMGVILMAVVSRTALAVNIGDITHLQGSRTNRLIGYGLVIGLNGTGDGGRFQPAIKSLSRAYEHLGNPVTTLDDLKDAKNVAVVFVEATLPSDGIREGEQVDVQISSAGAAKSLAGGRLLITPLVNPNPQDSRGPMAMAAGPLQIVDEEIPTVAKIRNGAQLERDWIHNYISLGRDLSVQRMRGAPQQLEWVRPDEYYVTFVIDKKIAEWGVACAVARAINESESVADVATGNTAQQLALAFDASSILVRLPSEVRDNPAPFLARLEGLQLFLMSTEARVKINRSLGSIVLTGNVEIAPTVISYKGLTITTMVPAREPTQDSPSMVEQRFVKMDPQSKGGARLQDLLDALNQLQVPDQDRIGIIEELNKTGKLYATLMVEP